MQTSVKYALCYLKLNETEGLLAEDGQFLTSSESAYYKKILLAAEHKYFSWKDFTDFVRVEMTKQGALKVLNQLERLGVLSSIKNSRGEKQFRLE